MGTAANVEAPALIDDEQLEEFERELVGRVRGRVLEIGAGEGETFGAFELGVEWIGLEPDLKRRAELATRWMARFSVRGGATTWSMKTACPPGMRTRRTSARAVA